MGGKDINFTDDSEFSERFVLQAENEKAIRKFFDKDVRKVFLNLPRQLDQLEMCNGLISITFSEKMNPKFLPDQLKESTKFARQLKEVINSLS